MSLHSKSIEPVPEQTARIARAAFPKGNVYLRLRDEIGSMYTDEAFADLFPAHGQPAEAPWRLAVVTVLQFAESLSDRQAADAVRAAPEWLRPRIRSEWIERYDHQLDEYRLPKKEAERAALAELIGADGFELLEAIYTPEAPSWLWEVPAVETLRRVWLQQYYAPDAGPIRWRSSADLPPAHLLINSPYDPDA